MDELERGMERAEGAGATETFADPDAAGVLKDAQMSVDPDAAVDLKDTENHSGPDVSVDLVDVENPSDPDVAEDVLKAAEAFAEPGVATEFALEPGEEVVHGGAVAAGEPTSVCLSGQAKQPTEVGKIAGPEEPEIDDAAARGREPEEAAEEAGSLGAAWRRRAESYALRAVFSEARAAAAAMGVPENRLDHVARLSDLSGIVLEDQGARDRIVLAVRMVLREIPEFHGGVGTGQVTAKRKPRRDAFERGFLGE